MVMGSSASCWLMLELGVMQITALTLPSSGAVKQQRWGLAALGEFRNTDMAAGCKGREGAVKPSPASPARSGMQQHWKWQQRQAGAAAGAGHKRARAPCMLVESRGAPCALVLGLTHCAHCAGLMAAARRERQKKVAACHLRMQAEADGAGVAGQCTDLGRR